jgi:hypothetical protein
MANSTLYGSRYSWQNESACCLESCTPKYLTRVSVVSISFYHRHDPKAQTPPAIGRQVASVVGATGKDMVQICLLLNIARLKEKIQSLENLAHPSRRKCPDILAQFGFIDSKNL